MASNSSTLLPTVSSIFITTESNATANISNYTSNAPSKYPSKYPSQYPSIYPSNYPTPTPDFGGEQEVKDPYEISTTYIAEILPNNENSETNHSVIIGVTVPIILIFFSLIAAFIYYYKFKYKKSQENQDHMTRSIDDQPTKADICDDIDDKDVTMQPNRLHSTQMNSLSGCDNDGINDTGITPSDQSFQTPFWNNNDQINYTSDYSNNNNANDKNISTNINVNKLYHPHGSMSEKEQKQTHMSTESNVSIVSEGDRKERANNPPIIHDFSNNVTDDGYNHKNSEANEAVNSVHSVILEIENNNAAPEKLHNNENAAHVQNEENVRKSEGNIEELKRIVTPQGIENADELLDGMLSDILQMEDLDPNKIHEINVNNKLNQDTDSEDSDNMYEK